MELWFTEDQTPNLRLSCKISKTLHKEKSKFQEIDMIETEQYGRMLTLDGLVMTTIKDEFVYHEMITHVPLFTHKNPKKVLVIGGGDGGAIREILKHPSVEEAVMVEIDGRVVEVCKEYLPEISCGLSDKRANVIIDDGVKYIQEHKNEFDVITIDSTDPIGPAVGLFAIDFYKAVYNALKDDGIFVAQTESPFAHKDLIRKVFKDVQSIFPITKLYTASIPTYPTGYWSFTMGSKKYDPMEVDENKISAIETRYFTPQLLKAAFAIPKFVQDIIK